MFVRGSKQVLARKNGNKIFKNSEIKRNYSTKLSHFVGEKPKTTLSPELTNSNLFGEILDHQAEQPARKYKDLLFHFSQNKRWTYSEFNKHVDATAIGLLQSARLTPGDILAATLNNDIENFTVRLATLKTAGIYASIAPDTNGETLAKYLDFLHPKSILTSTSYDNTDKLKDIYTLIPELATRAIGSILTSRRYPKLRSVILPQLKQEPGCYPLPAILVYNPFPSPLPALQQTLNPNNFAHLYFVNTSNGDFNAVGFSQKGMLDSARNFGAAIGLTSDCRVSSTLGIWHSSTQLLALSSLIFGSYYSISSTVFYPDAFLQSAATDHVTYIVTSPSHLSQILSFPAVGDFDLSSLNTIFIVSSEGEKYSADLVNAAKQKLGNNVKIVFGLNGNETFGPFLSSSSQLNSVGKTLPNSETKIVDQNNQVVPVGQSGRLLTKGASVMKGYYGKDTPVNVLNKEGWLATSFTAKADEEGNFYLV